MNTATIIALITAGIISLPFLLPFLFVLLLTLIMIPVGIIMHIFGARYMWDDDDDGDNNNSICYSDSSCIRVNGKIIKCDICGNNASSVARNRARCKEHQ